MVPAGYLVFSSDLISSSKPLHFGQISEYPVIYIYTVFHWFINKGFIPKQLYSKRFFQSPILLQFNNMLIFVRHGWLSSCYFKPDIWFYTSVDIQFYSCQLKKNHLFNPQFYIISIIGWLFKDIGGHWIEGHLVPDIQFFNRI